MNHPESERRRSSRVDLADRCRLQFGVSVPARILDISPAGVLLTSRVELAVGERGQLNVTIRGRSASLPIEIKHTAPERGTSGGTAYRTGAKFVPATPEERRELDELLLGVRRP